MKLARTLIFALIAIFGLASTKVVSTIKYTKKLFSVDLIETKKYTVKGNTVTIDMVYLDGTCSGKYFKGDLIYDDSSTVIKTFKDGRKESVARFYINGTDIDNVQSRIHIEDIYVGRDILNRPITKPNIITEVDGLTWLHTADVIGIVKKNKKGYHIDYMWNKKGKKSYPPAITPEVSGEYTKKVLTIDVEIPGAGWADVFGDGAGVRKLGFTCSSNTTVFQGVGADYFVDTRYNYEGQKQWISARYIIIGKDDEGKDMSIYVENEGTDDFGDNKNVQTKPFIVTDNPKWAWIESAPLHGTHSDVALQIFFWTVEDGDKN